MSGERALQLGSAQAHEAQRDDEIAPRDRQFCVGDPVPHVLTKQQLADFTGYSCRQIDRFRKAHSHPGIVQLDGPGHPRFCGRALKTWAESGSAEPVSRKYFLTTGRR